MDEKACQSSGLLWMLATVSLWSLIGLVSKYCLAGGMTPMQCALFRALFGGMGFCVHAVLMGKMIIPLRHALLFLLFGFWGFGAYFSLCQYTIKLSGAAMDIVLQYTAPFWVAIFARVFFGEKLTCVKIAALAMAACGTLCVCLSGGSLPGEVSHIGIACGLLSGLCYATHFPFTRHWQKKYETSTIFSWMLTGGVIVLLALASCEGAENLNVVRPRIWLVAILPGIVCTYLGYYCYGQALRRMDLTHAAVTSELEPVLSTLWVGLAFGERFSAIGWVGSALILSSVLVLTLLHEKGRHA